MNTFLWIVAQVSACRVRIVTLKKEEEKKEVDVLPCGKIRSHFLPIPFSATILSRLHQLRESTPDGFEKLWAHHSEGLISITVQSVLMLKT